MRIIIDTHVLIWYLNGDKELPARLIKTVEDPNNTIVISVATLWEITIKLAKEKLKTGISLDQIQEYIKSRDVELLDVEFNSLLALLKLPYHHGDPFDRMLIAQATAFNLPIISADRHFAAYPINVIW
jgi:PIN domain nuclease of toxin-antitoxin system